MSIEPISVSRSEQVEILKTMGLDPRLPMTKAVVLICERYGLDPILGHAIIVKNKPFLTHQGLLHIAHSSGQFDGISTTVELVGDEWVATATVYRKDMRQPFTYQGFSKKTEQNARDMAMIRAERRCFKRAFNVNVPVQGEAPGEDIDVAPDPLMPDDRPPLPEVAENIPVRDNVRSLPEPPALPTTVDVPQLGKGAAATPSSTTGPAPSAPPVDTGATTPGATPASAGSAATKRQRVEESSAEARSEADEKLAVARAKKLAIAASKVKVDEDMQDHLIDVVTQGRTTSRKEVDDAEAAVLLRIYDLVKVDAIDLRYDENGELIPFDLPVPWKYVAEQRGVNTTALLKEARAIAQELAAEMPSSMDDPFAPEVEAALWTWLEGQ